MANEGGGTATVSEDYLALLYDLLTENQAMFRETLGESGAATVFDWCADNLVKTVEDGEPPSHPLDAVIRRLSGWGMQVQVKEGEGKTEIEVQCPYAERIHPRLPSYSMKCPLGEYFLGAVRLEHGKSQLLSNHLTSQGVKFSIDTK